MRKHSKASWLLRSLLPTTHADSVLGDLLELAGDDQAEFQRLLLGTAWALLKRRIAGFLLAATVGGGGVVGLQSAFFTSLLLHTASHSQRAWGSTLAFLAGCLLVMVSFSVVRYGLRDRMTWLVFAFILPLAASALLWWVPGVPAIAEALLLMLSFAALLWPATRSAFRALALLVVLQTVLWFSAVGMLLKPLAILWRHAPADAAGMKFLASAAFAVSYVALVMFTCVLYSKVRRWAYA